MYLFLTLNIFSKYVQEGCVLVKQKKKELKIKQDFLVNSNCCVHWLFFIEVTPKPKQKRHDQKNNKTKTRILSDSKK